MLIKVGTEKKPEKLFFCEICTFTISLNTNKNDVSLPKSESKKKIGVVFFHSDLMVV